MSEPIPVRVSDYFHLGKTQAELDFVDVPVDEDVTLFVDPFAISQRIDSWSIDSHNTVVSFFQAVIDGIREGREQDALTLLSNLREPNETRFGFSRAAPHGVGIGDEQARQLYSALQKSSAVRTGLLSALEECELMVDVIGPDKISDLTTNVIRAQLATYTVEQCELHNIPRKQVAIGPCFNRSTLRWESGYLELPVADGAPILLVPKAIARRRFGYDHRRYYRHFALEYLRAEHLARGTLVTTLKSGKRVVYKTDLEERYPCTKRFLFDFSKKHPEALREYRDELAAMERQSPLGPWQEKDERLVAAALREVLKKIPPGVATASQYHSAMVGILEFLCFPNLIRPMKEKEINQGRKRIDIVMENGAHEGVFYRLHDVRKIPCAYIAIECKNYRSDIANPELDQMIGRFSTNRGRVGIVCCRSFENRALFIERCRDTLTAGHGVIVPLDDPAIDKMLEQVMKGQRRSLETSLSTLVDEIFLG